MMRFLSAVLAATIMATVTGGCQRPVDEGSTPKATGNRVGHLKGYNALNKAAWTRLFAEAETKRFELGWLLDGQTPFAGDFSGFRVLLGAFSGSSTHSEFQNGTPNSVNMLLWDLILSQLATGLATACDAGDGPGPGAVTLTAMNEATAVYKLRPEFYALLKQSCALPADDAGRQEILQGLWIQAMGYEAPLEEYQAWYAWFGAPAAKAPAATATERVRLLLKGLLMNPYFLLET